jgi:hypothetical protein
MNPTKISNPKNGIGTSHGAKKIIMAMITSPANMFPNNRNENETSLANSENKSIIPIPNPRADLKFKNLPM